MTTEQVSHVALLRHADFLRRIARDLVGEGTEADDLAQDVWVRALERGPRHESNLRGWLRVILVNMVRTRARVDSRRRIVTLDAIAEPAAPSLSEKEAVLRSVTDAVLALEEPLRATVLHRYFEGQSLAEIAQRSSLPLSTVKSRLQRAIETLRERMEREDRGGTDWRLAILALTSPRRTMPGPSSGATAGTGALVMTAKIKVALCCLVLVLASVAAWEVVKGPSTSSADSMTLGPGGGLADPAPAPPAQDLATDPTENTAARSVEATTIAPSTAAMEVEQPPTLLYGKLLDPEGKSLHGLWHAGVGLTDSDGRRRFCDSKSDGAFAFPGLPLGRYWLSASADGYGQFEDVITLGADRPQIHQDVVLQPVPILKIRATTPDGQNLLEALQETKKRAVLLPVATKEPPGTWFKETVGSLNNPFGIGSFWHYGPRVDALPSGYLGILILRQAPPAHASLVNYHRVLQTKPVQPGDEEVQFVVSVEDLLASSATISMKVVDADTLDPIQGAHAMLWGGTYIDRGERSDAGGLITFEAREPGEFDLRVSAPGHEEYRHRILADAGAPTELGQISLEKAIRFSAQVVDVHGTPRSASFALGSFDPASHRLDVERQRSYGSKGDGKLELEALGRHIYVLRTSNHDAVNDESIDPPWVSGNVEIDLRSGVAPTNFRITLSQATRVVILVSGASPDGLKFTVTDERGLDLVFSRFYGRGPRPLALPQGTYRIAIRDASGQVLSEKSVAVGSDPATVEFAR